MPHRAVVAGRAAAFAGAGVLALALTACGGGADGSDDPTDPGRGTGAHPTDSRPTHSGHTPHGLGHQHGHQHGQGGPTSTPSSPGGGSGAPAGSAQLGEPLRLGGLVVRALDYRKDGYQGAATGTRVDVVIVEECAESGPTTVQHQTWRLVDSDGRTVGAAGGKMVHGHPTEDLPRTLSTGECMTTALAIGVPDDSSPVAVQDGPGNTWVLAD